MENILNAIAWPVAAIIGAVVLMVIFRKPLSGLIERTRKISKGGISADPPLEAQQSQSDKGRENFAKLLAEIGSSPVRDVLEDGIRNDLKQKGIPSGPDTEKLLIKHLAGTQLLLTFETIYGLVFW